MSPQRRIQDYLLGMISQWRIEDLLLGMTRASAYGQAEEQAKNACEHDVLVRGYDVYALHSARLLTARG